MFLKICKHGENSDIDNLTPAILYICCIFRKKNSFYIYIN